MIGCFRTASCDRGRIKGVESGRLFRVVLSWGTGGFEGRFWRFLRELWYSFGERMLRKMRFLGREFLNGRVEKL